ncbi:hypothetical protein HELRODRAFT_186200 [Helobdella robusta]|uniref:Polyglutamine-binding protein 1 n=1 Tax=Helobdella robusta TaxID=6412 RepID=T1FNT2_HELRO|nr:hypothetical protein HELRODRAFT_186200 [Helobdella robusta]ESN90976.1 hypothetical protein HELRODRAFT_186200 [Helobdella robusta]
MPLPAALAAKLAKRGLLKSSASSDPVEEVIAEDYDDSSSSTQLSRPKKRITEVRSDHSTLKVIDKSKNDSHEDANNDDNNESELIHKITACPNIANPYHSCVEFCTKKWGYKLFKPDTVMLVKKEKMLSKYPIPNGWEEVGDPMTGRYYYWNTMTDEVSWLPPGHPRGNVTLPAERLKELNTPMNERLKKRKINRRDSDGEASVEEDDDEEEEDVEGTEADDSDLERERNRLKNKKGRKQDELDPMDPASYSDVPRGDWNTGLDQRGNAKTGVDVTASGPLFQQRPYPSPGAVLRINKGVTKEKK